MSKMSKLKSWLRYSVFILALVLIGFALRETVFRQEAVGVTVFRVSAGVVEETITNSKAGTIKTRKRAALSPEISGRVVALNFREGDRVTQSAILLRLNDDDYQAQVRLQQRSVDAAFSVRNEACIAAEQAERDHQRYLRLSREQIISEELLEKAASRRDTTASACEGARSMVLEAEAALDLARVNLSKTELRAPFDGVIAEITAELGEWITPSPPGMMIPPVIELLDNEAIYVSAPLDEVDLGRIRTDLPVRITIDAYPGQSFEGRVIRVAPYVLDLEAQNRTIEIEVEFVDSEFAGRLLPGTSADVEVILNVADDVLRIPSYALIEGNSVLVFENEHLISVPVTTGLTNWQYAEVSAGLTEDQLVVVSLDRIEVQEGVFAKVMSEMSE